MDESTRTRPAAPAAPVPARLASLRVTIVSGPGAGRSITVPRPRALVGRAETADLRLEDPTVSQFHADLTVTADGIHVVDLNSRNGTRAGGVKIERATVPATCALEFGATVVRVEPGEGVPFAHIDTSAFGGLVGESPAMRETYAMLARLARSDLSVLVTGETGTGKELAARAVHRAGPRAAGPFIVLDCAAIPRTLATSILFGHEKGAFTGAVERHPGVFEVADGGTLMLDEVGELPVEVQPMLLRVMQQREVVPVGGSAPRAIDVRFVSATWRDLRAMVNDGGFREDLYYRLAQATVRMPALGERPEDIGALVHFFLGRLPASSRAARAIALDALEALALRPYRGNVRELQNTVERLALLADGPVITSADLAFERMLASTRDRASGAARADATPADDGAPLDEFKSAKRTLVDEFERSYLVRLLARAENNLSRAAAIAGLERHNVRELLKKHGLYKARE